MGDRQAKEKELRGGRKLVVRGGVSKTGRSAYICWGEGKETVLRRVSIRKCEGAERSCGNGGV